jgi:hypothetical protein
LFSPGAMTGLMISSVLVVGLGVSLLAYIATRGTSLHNLGSVNRVFRKYGIVLAKDKV